MIFRSYFVLFIADNVDAIDVDTHAHKLIFFLSEYKKFGITLDLSKEEGGAIIWELSPNLHK